ncbi:hypothetical protein EV176_006864, partial [Coemansia sp. RSA 451]
MDDPSKQMAVQVDRLPMVLSVDLGKRCWHSMAELADSSHEDRVSRGPVALGDDLQGEFHSGLDNTDESEFDEEPYGSDESANMAWIAWFCSLKGHEYFCEIPDGFIEDDFNLTGLS